MHLMTISTRKPFERFTIGSAPQVLTVFTLARRLAVSGDGKETRAMIGSIKRVTLAVSLAVLGLGAVTTAEARDRYGDRGDNAAIAIGAGIVGLAIGAAIADRGDRNYYNRSYYPQRRYVRVRGYDDYYYYYPNNPNRYYRDRYYSRNYRDWNERRAYNRWERGQQRVERWYGRDYRRGDYRGRDYRGRDYRYHRGY